MINSQSRPTNRPVRQAHVSGRCCPSCTQSFLAAWGWVVLPGSPIRIFDLCGDCARTMRYGSDEQRQQVIEAITLRLGIARRAAIC